MKKLSKISIKLLAIIIGLMAMSGIALASSWPSWATSGTELNSHTITEPSGAIVYSGYLWVISDDGYLWRMGLDGSGKISSYLGSDLEGITQKDGYLYVVNEYPAIVYQVTPNTGSTATSTGSLTGSSWDLSATVTTSSTSAGVEALTTDGTNFYLGMQDDGDIYVYSSSFTYITKLTTPVSGNTDCSGLYYFADTGYYYALYDGQRSLLVLTLDSLTAPTAFTVVDQYTTLDSDWEGLAFDGEDLYIMVDRNYAADSYIYKYSSFLSTPPAVPDYTTISTVVKNRGKTITVTYASGDTQTLTYSAPYARVRTAITTDYKTLLILDGTTLYVYQNGACVYTFALLTLL